MKNNIQKVTYLLVKYKRMVGTNKFGYKSEEKQVIPLNCGTLTDSCWDTGKWSISLQAQRSHGMALTYK